MASVKKALQTMVVASALLLLSACASAPPNDSEVTGMHGSRTVLYQDVEHLLGDSTIVVRGVVVEQTTAEDQGITQTLSTLEVTESFAVAESDEGAPLASVVVRQYRDGDYSELPAPLLEQGQEYLLFLASAQIRGHDNHFWITGGQAGLYQADAGGEIYRRIAIDEGDALPEQLTAADYRALTVTFDQIETH